MTESEGRTRWCIGCDEVPVGDARSFECWEKPSETFNAQLETGFKVVRRTFRYNVASVLQEIQDLLIEKNEAYGNSALDPINVFSKASSVEQLKVRIDDKLNRLYHGKEYGQEDTVTDLIGYLVLLKIAEKEQADE